MPAPAPTAPDLERLAADHGARLRQCDGALPDPSPLDPADGTILSASADDSLAVGQARCQDTDPETFAAAFGSLHQHSLRVHLAGPDRSRALDELIDRWREHARAVDAEQGRDPRDPHSGAGILWPSRDTEGIRVLLGHGLAALDIFALRRPGHPHAIGPGRADRSDDEFRIRPAGPDDRDTVLALQLEALAYDDAVGSVTLQSGTPAALGEALRLSLASGDGTHWLAERSGDPVGLLALEFPPASDWVAGRTRAESVAYLEALGVRADQRGSGVGAQLVEHAHRIIDAAGIQTTVLHHSLINPRSNPFWNSHGYRPLWTRFAATPLSGLR